MELALALKRRGKAFLAAALIGGAFFVFHLASAAANPFAISFPIPELGNCSSVDECKIYCDDLSHGESCAAFGEAHGLATKKEVERARVLKNGGPGGCKSEAECRAYCDEGSHAQECLKFGEDNGLISKEDASRARKVVDKAGPGGCRGKECEVYCKNSEHEKECFEFAEREGLISKVDAERVRKTKEHFENKTGPGGCKGEDECRAYCNDPEHIDECVNFAVKEGFMTEDEAARVRGLAGKGPGGCRGEEECHAYCDDAAHTEECVSWGEQNGFIQHDDAERIKKLGGKSGPGGCRGDACHAYCADTAHTEECVKFGLENGFISKEEAGRALKFAKVSKDGGPGGCKGEECRTYCAAEEHREECFNFAKINGLISEDEAGQFERANGVRRAAEENGGPGGCKDEASCREYCSDPAHVSECINFASDHGGVSKEEASQMVQRFTEVKKYADTIREHHERFIGVSPQASGPEGQSGEFGGSQGGFQSGAGGFEPGSRFGRGPAFGRPGFQSGSAGFLGGPSFAPSTASEQAGFSGPGGCSSGEQCAAYCDNQEHHEDCVATFRRGARLIEAPSASAAVEIGPGGCRGLRQCLRYCEDRAHATECGKATEEEQSRAEERGSESQKVRPIGPPVEINPNGEVQGRESERQFPGQPGEFQGKSGGSEGHPGEFRGKPGDFPGGKGIGPGGFKSSPAGSPDWRLEQKGGREGFEPKEFHSEGAPLKSTEGGAVKRGEPFPVKPGEFPGRTGEFQGKEGESQGRPSGFFPPGGQFAPRVGEPFEGRGSAAPFPGQHQEQDGFSPSSSGGFNPPSPSGSFAPVPSGSFSQPPSSGGSFTPPPSGGSFSPPPSPSSATPPPSSPPPPPSGSIQSRYFLSLLFDVVKNFFSDR